MKRTLTDSFGITLPEEFNRLITGAPVYDSSSSPEARVYLIDKDCGYYLKVSGVGTLKTEALMGAYFHKMGLGAEVLYYQEHEGHDLLLTERVRGEDCTNARYLDEPKRLAAFLGQRLRELHELPTDGCPVSDRITPYLALADKNYSSGSLSRESLACYSHFKSHADAYACLCEGREALKRDTLIHGDFCLPNIILDDWRLSGYIDLGSGGVGDRHIDIFWGLWTLNFNLKTDRFSNIFLDAYGRDKIERERLTVVSAAEVFS